MKYTYSASVKSNVSDELINTYLIRPIAGILVNILFYTPVTPNQVTIAASIAGLCAAYFFARSSPSALLAAGLLITLKDILDSADGQLARAKQQFSRTGRFLDSIGDFVVDAAVFTAIGYSTFEQTHLIAFPVMAFLSFWGITLRVSYHVFYQTQFLHCHHQYGNNRVTEEIRQADIQRGGWELILQRVFQFLYGWQDRIMLRLDGWCRGEASPDDASSRYRWYTDRFALHCSGLLGFGTELFLLMICAVVHQLAAYLVINIVVMNAILLVSIIYRKTVLEKTIASAPL